MNCKADLLELVRGGKWSEACEFVEGDVFQGSDLISDAAELLPWLIKMNAPTRLVMAILKKIAKCGSFNLNDLRLLETCMEISNTVSCALPTFRALLDFGLSPNVLAEGGGTLFQKALELNKAAEVLLLLKHGLRKDQKSVFGIESTTNYFEASMADNDTARIALTYWDGGYRDA